MSRNNCLFWALPRWLKNYLAGEALVIRRSTFTWVPHFMRASCVKGLHVEEYIPERHPQKRVMRWLPIQAVLFKGRVRGGEATCLCASCRAVGAPPPD